jgi:hypothetical protein
MPSKASTTALACCAVPSRRLRRPLVEQDIDRLHGRGCNPDLAGRLEQHMDGLVETLVFHAVLLKPATYTNMDEYYSRRSPTVSREYR